MGQVVPLLILHLSVNISFARIDRPYDIRNVMLFEGLKSSLERLINIGKSKWHGRGRRS